MELQINSVRTALATQFRDTVGEGARDLPNLPTNIHQRRDAVTKVLDISEPHRIKAQLRDCIQRKKVHFQVGNMDLAILREHHDFLSRPNQDFAQARDRRNRSGTFARASLIQPILGLVLSYRLVNGFSPLQPNQHEIESSAANFYLFTLLFLDLHRSPLVCLSLEPVGSGANHPSTSGSHRPCKGSDPVRCVTSLSRDANSVRRAEDDPAEDTAEQRAEHCQHCSVPRWNGSIAHATPCDAGEVWGILA